MKLAAVLFAYAWIGAYFLDELFAYPAADAVTFTRWLTANPAALVAVGSMLVSVKFLFMGALFHWLRGESERGWALDGAAAWIGTLLIDLVFVAFATHFQMWVRPGGLLSLAQALNLGAAILGAWLAERYAWNHPGLREARQWLVETAAWARY